MPLDLNTPDAITVLAGTITMSPGTVSANLCADGSAIVHCLETNDSDATVWWTRKRRHEVGLVKASTTRA